MSTQGPPNSGPWLWIEMPVPPGENSLGGLAEEIGLDTVLPSILAELGEGWWEYGLVEERYARHDRAGFARMVERWGHTAIAAKQYTASSYLARCLGRLSSQGAVGYHDGEGTGRWSYNPNISWWASVPKPDWSERTSWADVHGIGHDVCRFYVPGAAPP